MARPTTLTIKEVTDLVWKMSTEWSNSATKSAKILAKDKYYEDAVAENHAAAAYINFAEHFDAEINRIYGERK